MQTFGIFSEIKYEDIDWLEWVYCPLIYFWTEQEFGWMDTQFACLCLDEYLTPSSQVLRSFAPALDYTVPLSRSDLPRNTKYGLSNEILRTLPDCLEVNLKIFHLSFSLCSKEWTRISCISLDTIRWSYDVLIGQNWRTWTYKHNQLVICGLNRSELAFLKSIGCAAAPKRLICLPQNDA